jgi:hypothetical protein
MAPPVKFGEPPGQEAALEPSDILTPEQLARRLQLPLSWVYKHTDNSHSNGNRLPVLRCGEYLRFDWPEVVAWMRSNPPIPRSPRKRRRKKAADISAPSSQTKNPLEK